MSNQAPKVDAGAKLLFILSAVALLGAVYILVSSLINTYTKNSTRGEITTSSNVEKAANNLKPVGTSSTSDAPVAAATSTAARSGKEVYAAVCQACHATGVAGSPKLDDKAAWEPRVATGLDALMT
ncbi:MAG TPA: cytochrome c5 family protein, partial [Leucothrix sp.]|nr:cytochrome c5 family protein [Leucothrix sp.]